MRHYIKSLPLNLTLANTCFLRVSKVTLESKSHFVDNPHYLPNIFIFQTFLKQLIFFFVILQGVIQLEKELANLGGVCAAALMKKDLALPIGKSGQALGVCL